MFFPVSWNMSPLPHLGSLFFISLILPSPYTHLASLHLHHYNKCPFCFLVQTSWQIYKMFILKLSWQSYSSFRILSLKLPKKRESILEPAFVTEVKTQFTAPVSYIRMPIVGSSVLLRCFLGDGTRWLKYLCPWHQDWKAETNFCIFICGLVQPSFFISLPHTHSSSFTPSVSAFPIKSKIK